MSTRFRLDDIRRARESDDPGLVDLVVALAPQPDEEPDGPIRDGAPTFARYIAEIHSKAFFKARTPRSSGYTGSSGSRPLNPPRPRSPRPSGSGSTRSSPNSGRTTARMPARA